VREPIATARLVLVPMTPEVVTEMLAGDVSGIRAAEGYPHEDTLVPMRTAAKYGVDLPGWFVTLDGLVIGDCHTHGSADEAGDIEIGYGLAEPYRGRGLGSELVKAFSQWLLRQEGNRRVVARHVPVDNVPSRRALESAGFVLEDADEEYTWYALTAEAEHAPKPSHTMS
jgi:RimJ/RimL family protein N-acetyltransferase